MIEDSNLTSRSSYRAIETMNKNILYFVNMLGITSTYYVHLYYIQSTYTSNPQDVCIAPQVLFSRINRCERSINNKMPLTNYAHTRSYNTGKHSSPAFYLQYVRMYRYTETYTDCTVYLYSRTYANNHTGKNIR
jgi:hypothetical protein